jgi:signal recognition particle GTPase
LGNRRDQLRQIKKLGSTQSMLKMLPVLMQQAASNVDESQFTRIEAIINSMTSKERHNSAIINGSRRKRIALGSAPPFRRSTTSSDSTPRCPNSSKAWAAWRAGAA